MEVTSVLTVLKGSVIGAGKRRPSLRVIMRQKRYLGKWRPESIKAHGVEPVGLKRL
jgi:hypothetical protein